MTTIHLNTSINGPKLTVFDLARDITEHENSSKNTREKAIAGRTSGKINLGETVTWRGKHFGLYLQHTSIISEMEVPTFFVDEMVKGVFKSFRHEHIFKETDTKTEMIDILRYEVPYGIFGQFFNYIILKSYLTKFLRERNQHIKHRAELLNLTL